MMNSFVVSQIIRATKFIMPSDPMTIIRDNTSLGSSSNSAFDWLNLGTLFYVLKKNMVIIGSIAALACLISMIFVSRADVVAEKKADFMHRLFIIFLGVSAPTLFGWMYTFFNIFLL